MMQDNAAHWLTAQRLRIYPVIFLVIYALIGSSWFMLSSNLIDHHGTPLGADFITFWSVSHIGLHGNPTDAYDINKIHAIEASVVPGSGSFAWLYPPTFYAAILPLATLPYVISYVVFMGTTLAAYLAVMWRVSPTRQSLVLALAFPGVLLNVMNGQNAFLTAALAGLGLLLMQTRPILAGVCIGLLAIKPHLALLFPVIMIMTAAWTAMLSAAITCMCLVALSIALLGLPVWETFLHSVSQARQLNEMGALPWEKMPTIFSNARVLGMSVTSAYIMHGVIALMSTLIMFMVWRGSSDLRLRGSAFVTATLLISPHLFFYDMVWLALPIAWLGLYGQETGWQHAHREVLVLAWLSPLLILVTATLLSMNPGPLVNIALLLMTLSLTRSSRHTRTHETGILQQ